MILTGCSSSPAASPEVLSSSQEISAMEFTDDRLNTGIEWDLFFKSHEMHRYNNDEVIVRAVNGLSFTAGFITPSSMYPLPSTGSYQKSVTLTVCSDGSYSGSTGRGTCSHHGGVSGSNNLNMHVDVIQIWSCQDTPGDGYIDYLNDVSGHAFLNDNSCERYGGKKSEYTFSKTYVD
jgi:hypothetical protein